MLEQVLAERNETNEPDRRRAGHFLEEIYKYQGVQEELGRAKKRVIELEGAVDAMELGLIDKARELYQQEATYRILADLISRASAPKGNPSP